MNFSRSLILPIFLCGLTFPSAAQEDLDVFSGNNQWLHHTDARNSLYHHLAAQAYDHLAKRSNAIAKIATLNQWRERQQWTRQTLDEIIGPLPRRTPLNAQTLRIIEKDRFRVEHIVFESQPGFYVTSSLYVPAAKAGEKLPTIVYCSGHSPEGYRSPVYQHVILNLVSKGFVVFAFDPVGQGERLEYFDPQTKKSRAGGPTSEHSYPGSQAFISGSSQARYMIWDGIRAVDYLLSRPEVDPSRLGITGRSGGGTQAAYIAAYDERIHAAAPECYLTNFTRLLQSIGPQDAEQNFLHGIARGLDHGDLLIVRAPRPALMITTTRDMFSIQGARETAAEASRVYHSYGKAENFAMVEDDAAHASTPKNREAMYAFFQKHLKNPGSSSDEEVMKLSNEELRVTPTGQVSTSLGGQTVFSLNRDESARYPSPTRPEVVAEAKRLSGYIEPETPPDVVATGRIQRDGYSIEKYFVKGEGLYAIPCLLFSPSQPTGKIMLYLDPAGKSAAASPGGEIEYFVKKGFMVIAPDLPGFGELGAGDFEGDAFLGGVSHNIWYSAALIGRSITGIHAGDIIRVVGSVHTGTDAELYAVAKKELAPAMLHAAAFFPRFKKVALVEPLVSYASLVSEKYYHSPLILGAVPAALKAYDLPQLASTLSPGSLLMINPVNGRGEKATDKELKEAFAEPGAGGPLLVDTGTTTQPLQAIYNQWTER